MCLFSIHCAVMCSCHKLFAIDCLLCDLCFLDTCGTSFSSVGRLCFSPVAGLQLLSLHTFTLLQWCRLVGSGYVPVDFSCEEWQAPLRALWGNVTVRWWYLWKIQGAEPRKISWCLEWLYLSCCTTTPWATSVSGACRCRCQPSGQRYLHLLWSGCRRGLLLFISFGCFHPPSCCDALCWEAEQPFPFFWHNWSWWCCHWIQIQCCRPPLTWKPSSLEGCLACSVATFPQ